MIRMIQLEAGLPEAIPELGHGWPEANHAVPRRLDPRRDDPRPRHPPGGGTRKGRGGPLRWQRRQRSRQPRAPKGISRIAQAPRALPDGLLHVGNPAALEGFLQGEDFPGQYPKGIDVALGVVGTLPADLGGHVPGRSTESRHAKDRDRVAGKGELPCESKVKEGEVSQAVEANVVGLDVPVEDPVPVQVGQGARQIPAGYEALPPVVMPVEVAVLVRYRFRSRFGVLLLPKLQLGVQRPVEPVKDQKVVFVKGRSRGGHAVQPDDVAMARERGEDPCLGGNVHHALHQGRGFPMHNLVPESLEDVLALAVSAVSKAAGQKRPRHGVEVPVAVERVVFLVAAAGGSGGGGAAAVAVVAAA
mmetsp:Transcript_8858/g.26288  ORF Transcript_8858/g.26288 Transcript_8858/m.26288 type:complete len:360 (-) Transcript_8858:475-1554(-)